ncbi:uncharacterized protein N7459_003802 [Penicillium hispanicum]|uniref:uncharacterized protein n=1 Tax=Penicillium hispanicum TaxID=1080232 RepID=UPI002540FBDF|nr:uncharacterized protein N7459_003802 [Penicillium hispanicum]KAJ5584002.1 hypothetical protein N7459_003802 [Penicillium hispanicum]
MSSPGPSEQDYPPDLSEERLLSLVAHIKDWQINHGSLLKLVRSETENSVLSQPVGVSCFPTLFPRARFQQALELQHIYNKLYCSVAEDEEWIYSALQDLILVEPLAAALWSIYEAAKEAGLPSRNHISVGIFRSDYMLHTGDMSSVDSSDSPRSLSETTLKQVELNTFSCAGATHANKVVDMHRYLARSGVYDVGNTSFDLTSLPANNNIDSLASCLSLAHDTYGPPKSGLAKQTAVLFIVQPNNFNIADERPIEYALWNRPDPVPAYRLEFHSVLEHTRLAESRALLFQPPWLASTTPVEISVVYLRAGYEADEYDPAGWEARLRLEMSTAIKCPSILSHLSTFKKIQQALTVPGALERFLSDSEAAAVRDTFVPLHPLDESKAGRHARDLACDLERSDKYILKPSLEGGGHNIYGHEIPPFLRSIPEHQWSAYILMERIQPPLLTNLLMGPAGIEGGEVVSELGIVGCCLWERSSSPDRRCDLLHNATAGWTFKTKHADVDEMSVVKGYGCFDTPHLVDV